MRKFYKYIVLLVFFASCSGQSCKQYNENCRNCDLCLCINEGPINISCTHQLVSQEDVSTCLFRKLNSDEKERDLILQPWMDLYPWENRPFLLQSYFQWTLFKPRTAFNITFNNLISTDVKYLFRFRNLDNSEQDLGREFLLKNLPEESPHSSNRVFWNCPFFNDYTGKHLTLNVADDLGSGGEYSFIVPDPERINSITTSLRNWQLFLMVDVGHFKRHHEAVVSLQMAPFNNLHYSLQLHCCQQKNTCSNGTFIEGHQFQGHQFQGHQFQGSDLEKQIGVGLPWAQKTVKFALPRKCMYRILAQILHDDCPAKGCYISQSPMLELDPDYLLQNILLCGAAFIFFIIILGLLYLYKNMQHKELIRGLMSHPTSLLLVYLPETKAHFDFIKTLAKFLRENCFVNVLLVDTDASLENPNEWTINFMENADRVVFLVPSDPDSKSITPIGKQWQSSLSHFNSCRISHNTHKFATLLTPSANASLPSEIANLRRFHLICDMTLFVTWIHDGTFLNKWLLWRSHVTSVTNKTTMSHLKASVNNLSKQSQVSAVLQNENNPSQTLLLPLSEQHPLHNEDQDSICTKAPGDDFDPNILSVEYLMSYEKNQDQNDDILSCYDESDEMSDELFV